jgi:hypothetical protein
MESECIADPQSARGVLTDSHSCRQDQTKGPDTKNQGVSEDAYRLLHNSPGVVVGEQFPNNDEYYTAVINDA